MQRRPIFCRTGGPGALPFAKRKVFDYYSDCKEALTTASHPSQMLTRLLGFLLEMCYKKYWDQLRMNELGVLGRDLLPST